ncbi:GxxExxY protein [Chryseobacterium sp. C-71]|uniref:GxxExxY protein n=1 Tax=Chryseobacterium sp. C-71 TaxID=2893882 RepID=UPI002D1E3769|nr:GxxExxY protein [Chryseobacterium sp. C-71]
MDIIYKEESYKIIGICMEIHNFLGHGFSEIVYKDALEIELRKAGIFYEREKEYEVVYKGVVLPHKFYADFVLSEKIILEIKGKKEIIDEDIAQAINYQRFLKIN